MRKGPPSNCNLSELQKDQHSLVDGYVAPRHTNRTAAVGHWFSLRSLTTGVQSKRLTE
jgi:hypothetical protein